MVKEEIIPLIIHHMLQFNEPFSEQELHSTLEQQGIIIENIKDMVNHFLYGETLVATGEKYEVNVKTLFQ